MLQTSYYRSFQALQISYSDKSANAECVLCVNAHIRENTKSQINDSSLSQPLHHLTNDSNSSEVAEFVFHAANLCH